jgi:hypothetical protein
MNAVYNIREVDYKAIVARDMAAMRNFSRSSAAATCGEAAFFTRA